jgi:hypothetical protein
MLFFIYCKYTKNIFQLYYYIIFNIKEFSIFSFLEKEIHFFNNLLYNK